MDCLYETSKRVKGFFFSGRRFDIVLVVLQIRHGISYLRGRLPTWLGVPQIRLDLAAGDKPHLVSPHQWADNQQRAS